MNLLLDLLNRQYLFKHVLELLKLLDGHSCLPARIWVFFRVGRGHGKHDVIAFGIDLQHCLFGLARNLDYKFSHITHLPTHSETASQIRRQIICSLELGMKRHMKRHCDVPVTFPERRWQEEF